MIFLSLFCSTINYTAPINNVVWLCGCSQSDGAIRALFDR
ncbi:MAG: hypothetical protein OFPII_27510 [Osedax symbiont Rs1]|nr:MAG: hypothetical protein OFPII_27510 [Osedax symbiont Rs1]